MLDKLLFLKSESMVEKENKMGKVIDFSEARKIVKDRAETPERTKKWRYRPQGDVGDNLMAMAIMENYSMATAAQVYALNAFRQKLASFRRPYRVKLPTDFEKIMLDPKGECPSAYKKS